MHTLLADPTTLGVIHALDHEPDTAREATSTNHAMPAGGSATNAAVTIAALESLRPMPSYAPASSVTLFSAVGKGTIASIFAADLGGSGVSVLDASAVDPLVSVPATSSITEHSGGRIAVPTNAWISVDIEKRGALLVEAFNKVGSPDMVLIDGHNLSLANLVLGVGVIPEGGVGEDPLARLEEKSSRLRILDGSPWKERFASLLPLMDVVVVSADFCPPLLGRPEIRGVIGFLYGFGITCVVRIRGPEPVEWVQDERRGTTAVDEIRALSVLSAGDVFHGVFTWAFGILHEEGRETLEDLSKLIAFAAQIASTLTSVLGICSWHDDPRVVGAVEEFLNFSEVRDLRRDSASR